MNESYKFSVNPTIMNTYKKRGDMMLDDTSLYTNQRGDGKAMGQAGQKLTGEISPFGVSPGLGMVRGRYHMDSKDSGPCTVGEEASLEGKQDSAQFEG